MTICMYSDQIQAYKKSLNIPKGQQKPYIKVQTIQWPKEKRQIMT